MIDSVMIVYIWRRNEIVKKREKKDYEKSRHFSKRGVGYPSS